MPEIPTAEHLIEAARHSLKTEIIPALAGEQRKEAAMIARALAIVARELADGGHTDRQIVAAWSALYPDLAGTPQPIDVLSARIVDDIRRGAFDDERMRDAVEAVLMIQATLKLDLSNKGFLYSSSQ